MHSELTKKGFTLIELLVAITILSILATIGLVTYSNAQIAGRDGKRKQDLRALATALELYYQSQPAMSYPNSTRKSTDSNWENLLGTDYINQMPVDPTNNTTFNYQYSGSGASYTLCTNLENNSDPDINSVCTGGYNFGLKNP